MKKIYLIALIGILSFVGTAQTIEVTGFYGYTLNGKLRTYYGDYNVADAPDFGGILSIEMYKDGFIELMYLRNDTEFSYSRSGITQATIGMSSEFYQIGTLKQLDIHEIVKPFGTASLGVTRFHPKDSYDWDDNGSVTSLNDAWRFSATIGAGLKLILSDALALRLQARLLMPMEFNGLFIGIGSGGASGGASFRVPIVSGDFTAGLALRINK